MRPSALAILGLVVLLTPAMGGCLEKLGLGGLSRPDYHVSRTPLAANDWNTDGTFTVQVDQAEPVEVVIDATPQYGAKIRKAGLSDIDTPVTVDLPDGTWTVTYSIGGHKWETFEGVRIDTVPPEITGLPNVVRAPTGSATVGTGANVEADAELVVRKQDGTFVADSLPFQVSGLADGVHVYQMVATDPAGNEASATVQVLSGSAQELPEPKYTAGIVARYTTELRLWDLTHMDDFVSPATARATAPDYLGSGQGVTPDDPAVKDIVAQVVQPGMTTGEAALALYRWMYDHLEYDKARLEEDDLLDPAQTIQAGGGVCRDLAGLYASLLRAAGIPARLVAGYLAGEVNGFHAWVEFYGGFGPSAWVPVDVSGINGPYKVSGMLQSFAIALPEHLAMRALTPEEEQTDWSTAALLSFRFHEPNAPFLKDVSLPFQPTTQNLCVNLDTFARAARSNCGREHNAKIDNFPVLAVRILDYGIDVKSAPDGTELTLSIVYPDAGTVSPDEVTYRTYFEPKPGSGLSSGGFHEDTSTGRAVATINA